MRPEQIPFKGPRPAYSPAVSGLHWH